MSLECLCVKKTSSKVNASAGILKARLSASSMRLKAKSVAEGSFSVTKGPAKAKNISATLSTETTIKARTTSDIRFGACIDTEGCNCCAGKKTVTIRCSKEDNLVGVGSVGPRLKLFHGLNTNARMSGSFRATYTDKFAGDFSDEPSSHKMYPIADVSSYGFINESGRHAPLYSSIDEGVFTGFYHKHLGESQKMSDEKTTWIQPSSVYTEGTFSYKCKVTKPTTWLKDSRLHIRAAGPLTNFEDKSPPEYTIKNIKLLDPSGGLITQYGDMKIRGDADFKGDFINFATYSSKPVSNKAGQYQWQNDYPLLWESASHPSGYTLSFDIQSKSMDDPFDTGYEQAGFQQKAARLYQNFGDNDFQALDGSPLSTRTQRLLNPTDALRISAIEISSHVFEGSSGIGPAKESRLSFVVQADSQGTQIERKIYPTEFKSTDFDTGINPEKLTLWSGYNTCIGASYNNANGSKALTNFIRSNNETEYVALDSILASESGKMTVKFGHETPDRVFGYVNGAFSIGLFPSGAFDTAYKASYQPVDNFFPINTVSLRVYARKAAGASDYPIDVVGYSDDQLLHVTSATGGFLQNPSGCAGTIPTTSGFNQTDHFALDGESVSDKSQYFTSNKTNNAGGDHYLVCDNVVTNTDSFKWYEIPLTIYKDDISVGWLYDYGQSTFFENLILDIYPLPSGAEIAAMELSVTYPPANAMQLYTVGGDIARIQDGRSEGKIYPSSRQSADAILNAGSGYAPLSTISGIPHAYSTPTTIKSNYSRRWRGIEGTVNGPYDPNQFGFGFENPLVDFPFLSGYFDFDYDNGNEIISRSLGQGLGALSGNLFTTYTKPKYTNIGWRFSSGVIFNDKLPNYSGAYETTDWTSLASGATNFKNHELYGKIADAFNNVVRVSGADSYINFGPIDTASGFAIFTRFSPDCDMSGVTYNLWDSGVLVSKWDNGKNLEFTLGYESGYLCGQAKDNAGNTVKVKDSLKYYEYQYPLSVILTYNDHKSSGLKLYTDNEFESSFTNLRAQSSPFTIKTDTNNLTLGYSSGSGIGINAFVSEFGVSTYGASGNMDGTNIVTSGANLLYKEVTAEKFLENHRVYFWESSDSTSSDSYKLWDYVNEDTSKWDLGAFKYCSFAPAFDWFTKREGRDLVGFNIVHQGSGYSQVTNLTEPSKLGFSGIAYHTQVENDFLRFNLSDAASNFHSVPPRISKTLPRGYSFKEDAIVVDSVIEHNSSGNIIWEDGKTGPKLIVSLYTKRRDPYWTPTEDNWGLINRATHYLTAETCFERIESKFDFDSFVDTTESWALFPKSKRVSEFSQKYYSEDINKMFLQYDLVYPSGSNFTSRINLHSAHVRLVDAFVKPTEVNNNFKLAVSGDKKSLASIDLSLLPPTTQIDNLVNGASGLPLFTKHSPSGLNSNLTLAISGALYSTNTLPLILPTVYPSSGIFNLYASGQNRPEAKMNLVAYNEQSWFAYPSSLPLSMFGSSKNSVSIFSEFNLFALGDDTSRDSGLGTGSMNIYTNGGPALVNHFPEASMNLFIDTPNIVNKSIPLTLFGEGRISEDSSSNQMNLFTANYSSIDGGGLESFFWNGNSYGSDIEVTSEAFNDDEHYTSKFSNDEIRGVETMGYGSCISDSPKKIIKAAMVSHGTTWSPSGCVDAGIARAHSTYTNTSAGYSGNYYNITKYTGLVPNTLYDVTLKGKSGSNKKIELPRVWEEWEYGICGPSYNPPNGCCGDSDCTEGLAFSGVKFTADFPYMSGLPELTPPSGRNTNDKYGFSVAIDDTLMAVSAPFHEIKDETGIGLKEAGAVFVYDRQDQAKGGEKAPWHMSQKLMLPSGFRGDYSVEQTSSITFPGMPAIKDRKWYVGQEGRRFGHSIDMTAGSGDKPREIIVVGSPSATWSRTFTEIDTSGIPVGVMVVTDEFSYGNNEGAEIENEVRYWDKLYKYYASHPAELDLKVSVVEPTGIFGSLKENQGNLPDFITHTKVGRKNIGVSDDVIFSGIQSAFLNTWPYNSSASNSGIPVVLGIYVDASRSLGRAAIEPAIDKFKQWYRDYSYASGVRDFYGNKSEGHLYEYFPNVDTTKVDYHGDPSENSKADLEDWVSMSKRIINNTLDTGRLVQNDALRFITSGIGAEFANLSATDFNIPPDSGGRVHVFEKINGQFDLIQEIKAPSAGPFEVPDRFGHAVAVSKDSNTIVIGSPYAQDNCLAYTFNPSARSGIYTGLEGWLNDRSDFYQNEITLLGEYKEKFGNVEAAKRVYDEINESGRYQIRVDLGIEEYSKVFSYTYNDINYEGMWQFVADKWAPTSRLGYSCAVNEDGTTVAFGAPTDSFNQFDDLDVWYKNKGDTKDGNLASNTWASTTNAGAVRVFDGRKYHQHNKVVEFTRFGNLDRNAHIVSGIEPDSYTDLNDVYHDFNFSRTEYTDNEIPKEAGLAYIITPQIDSASDEVIGNIKDWLALGDRTLVLVGNDPTWEENGRYKKSNDILNKILSKLNSKMRIHSARNQYESLPDCAEQGKPNVTAAFLTNGQRSTNLSRSYNIYAKGVGDIRMHVPTVYKPSPTPTCVDETFSDTQSTEVKTVPFILNDRCNMPIQHNGDLRAQWNESCRSGSKCDRRLVYQRNWSFEFGTSSANCCAPQPTPPPLHEENPSLGLVAGREPIALLTAAEYLPPSSVVIPATEGKYVDSEVCENHFIEVKENTSRPVFGENHVKQNSFVWSDAEFDGIESSVEHFENPEPLNGRDAMLQKTMETQGTFQKKQRVLLDPLPLISQEDVGKSKVVMIASVLPENEKSLTKGNDHNISFYLNLVQKSCGSKGRIMQLGGWTKRKSFTDGFKNSLLKKLFTVTGNTVVEDFDRKLMSTYNVAWIANSAGIPDESEAADIKSWLDRGGNTLVITYDHTVESARNAHTICESLGLEMSPVYSGTEGEYKQANLSLSSGYEVDKTNKIIDGCGEESVVSEFSVVKNESSYGSYSGESEEQEVYYPIMGGSKVVWLAGQITEEYIAAGNPKYYMNTGVAQATFNVVSGSGYRIFYSWVSEQTNENRPLRMHVAGVSQNADPDQENGSTVVFDLNEKLEKFARFQANVKADLNYNSIVAQPASGYLDVMATGPKITIAIEGTDDSISNSNNAQLKTVRFLEVSGAPLPIEQEITTKTKKVFSHKTCTKTQVFIEGEPESISVIPEQFRPIKTDHAKYCGGYSELPTEEQHQPTEYETFMETQLVSFHQEAEAVSSTDCSDKKIDIEDGPVVVAEEIETFSSFSAGEKRSTIIVISDASVVQGECDFYRSENQLFLRHLYPKNPVLDDNDPDEVNLSVNSDNPELNSGLSNPTQGSKYTISQKLIAPDRGSAGKYRSAAQHAMTPSGIGVDPAGSGRLALRFNGLSYGSPAMGVFYDNESSYKRSEVERDEEVPETKEAQLAALQAFEATFNTYGMAPMFSGGVTGHEDIGDATYVGGMPEIITRTGYDYLDFDQFPSGYPGDLFGYSIDIHRNRLIVGAPFNGFVGEESIRWSGVQANPSGSLLISGNGGAGAAYYFEKTGEGYNAESSGLLWQYIRKIKPSSVNAGYDNWNNASAPDADTFLGTNDYRDSDLKDSYITDQFGHDVSIDEDFIAIGAPGHNFDVYHEHVYNRTANGVDYDGSFIRKEFDFEFDIPLHAIHDLGESGVRAAVPSGHPVLNNGAIFTYVYEVSDSGEMLKPDWGNREKSWRYGQKIVPQGYAARSGVTATDDGGTVIYGSGSENDMFGRSVAIDRVQTSRGDADYTLVGGAARHKYSTSGSYYAAPSSVILNAGAIYTFDAMLRRQTPSIPSQETSIYATLGLTGSGGVESPPASESIKLSFSQADGANIEYFASGYIVTNPQGEIFLETSGYDPAANSMPEHRPFIESVVGKVAIGTEATNHLSLYTSGLAPQASSVLNMNILSQPSATVYNNIGLYTPAVSGIPTAELKLFTKYDPIETSGILKLYTSGVASSGEQLNLSIRGK